MFPKLVIVLLLTNFNLFESKLTTIKVPDEDGTSHDAVLDIVGDEIIQTFSMPTQSRPAFNRWPNGVVPFTMTNQFSAQERNVIVRWLNDLSRQTRNCVRFVPRQRQHRDFVKIFKSGRGCFAHLGRISGENLMSLDTGCVSRGVIKHEALHNLGFSHTQSRMDRDRYLRVLLENVDPNQRHNFNRHRTNNELVPFDYQSIMLYGPFAFSRNGRRTMEARNRRFSNFGGNTLINRDVEMVRRLYNCRR